MDRGGQGTGVFGVLFDIRREDTLPRQEACDTRRLTKYAQ